MCHAVYASKDIRSALDRITLDDLKDMPIPGYDAEYEEKADCPFNDFSEEAPDLVAWADVVLKSVLHWFEVSRKHGYTFKPVEQQGKRPIKITTIAKYAPDCTAKKEQQAEQTASA